MSRVVFFNLPAQGHINPPRDLICELVARGEDVFYYATDEYRNDIEATGATYRPYPACFLFDRALMTGPRLRLVLHLLKVSQQLIKGGFLEEVRALRPDYVIHDHFAAWGKHLAHMLCVPAVCSHSFFAIHPRFIRNYVRLLGLRAFSGADPLNMAMHTARSIAMTSRYGVELAIPLIRLLNNKQPLNIVYTSRALQPHGDRFDTTFLFVGPLLSQRMEDQGAGLPVQRLPDKKLIYISLGTLDSHDIELFKTCFDALGNTSHQVLLAVTDRQVYEALPPAPPNFTVAPYLPQLAILKHADLFITHGGGNSVNESLYYGVPLVVAGRDFDRLVVADHVQRLGLGVALPQSANPAPALREAVDRVMHDESYRAKAEDMGRTLRDAGGLKKAADAVFQFKAEHGVA